MKIRSEKQKEYEKLFKKTSLKYKASQSRYNKIRYSDPEYLEYMRRRRLKTNYNLTVEDYDKMLVSQCGRCAICFKPQAALKIRLNVDHCHKTGKIRGLLCNNCNRGIGYLKDNVTVLLKAIKYLKRSKQDGTLRRNYAKSN